MFDALMLHNLGSHPTPKKGLPEMVPWPTQRRRRSDETGVGIFLNSPEENARKDPLSAVMLLSLILISVVYIQLSTAQHNSDGIVDGYLIATRFGDNVRALQFSILCLADNV